MIANCPSCGTHFKHEPPPMKVRARCGRCDTALDLTRLSPYRIVSAVASPAELADGSLEHVSIGVNQPERAMAVARHAARPAPAMPPVRPPDNWEDEDPLPQIPEDVIRESDADDGIGRTARGDGSTEAVPSARAGAATFALWLATGAIAGTGANWTMGGATTTGMAVGAALGAVAGWGWLRWTSPK